MVIVLLAAQWSRAEGVMLPYKPEPTVLPLRATTGDWKDTSGTYVRPEVTLTGPDEREVQTMGVTDGRGGDLKLDPRMQYEYFQKMATDMVEHTMDQLDKTVGRNEVADVNADAEQAGEWVTEGGGDDARAGGEVQVDEDGNEVEEEAQAEELGRMEAGIDLLQEDERLYLRFYKNLTLALGVALVACVGLVAWVVYNGGLQPSPSIQWRRLPAAICVALSASLDRNTLDSETAQRLRQAQQRADDAYKSIGHTAMEIAGMRSP